LSSCEHCSRPVAFMVRTHASVRRSLDRACNYSDLQPVGESITIQGFQSVMKENRRISVLFVCMGNICRSPTAQAVFEHLVKSHGLSSNIEIDSAGTHAYHVGEPPDKRAMQAARKRGLELGGQRARRVSEVDFDEFDYVLAMDRDNYDDLLALCPPEHQSKLYLFLQFADEADEDEVPDPYYGGITGFERVLDLIEQAARGLLAEIRQQHRL
jgi:protein-tyrosine phosphatase